MRVKFDTVGLKCKINKTCVISEFCVGQLMLWEIRHPTMPDVSNTTNDKMRTIFLLPGISFVS